MNETPSISSAKSPSSGVQWLTVDADQAGQRLDNYLAARLKGLPKSRIYSLIRKGEVRVNKGRSRPEYKLMPGDQVRIPPVRLASPQEPVAAAPGLLTLLTNSVLFENEGLLVINKPPGLAVHGGSGVSLGLIEALRQLRPEARYLELVHRLDRDTSGCIMIAKKRSMLRHLQAALRDKGASDIRKVYQALVKGPWSPQCRRVDAPLLKIQVGDDEKFVRVHPAGKPSLTEFRLLESFGEASLVEARPITGRTHQIRVHARHQGHCLVGDEKYGDDEFNKRMRDLGVRRLFLHAAALGFYLPESSEMTWVEAPLAEDLAAALDKLRAGNASARHREP